MTSAELTLAKGTRDATAMLKSSPSSSAAAASLAARPWIDATGPRSSEVYSGMMKVVAILD